MPATKVRVAARRREALQEVAECVEQANSIPERIVHLPRRVGGQARGGGVQYETVVVDAFTGFGSVGHAMSWARRPAWRPSPPTTSSGSRYYNLDMGTPGNLAMLIQYARIALRQLPAEAREDLTDDKVAVLLWLSTPCNTYGPQGGAATASSTSRLTRPLRRPTP